MSLLHGSGWTLMAAEVVKSGEGLEIKTPKRCFARLCTAGSGCDGGMDSSFCFRCPWAGTVPKPFRIVLNWNSVVEAVIRLTTAPRIQTRDPVTPVRIRRGNIQLPNQLLGLERHLSRKRMHRRRHRGSGRDMQISIFPSAVCTTFPPQ